MVSATHAVIGTTMHEIVDDQAGTPEDDEGVTRGGQGLRLMLMIVADE